jgi:hypothetical protein
MLFAGSIERDRSTRAMVESRTTNPTQKWRSVQAGIIRWHLPMMVFALSLLQPSWALSAGLPDRWERAVYVIEISRPYGLACPPPWRRTTSLAEEAAQPEFCPVATGFLMRICGQDVLISNRHVFARQTMRLVSREHISEYGVHHFIRVERTSGGLLRLPVGGTWRAHPNSKIDLAASLISLPPNVEKAEIDFTFFDEDKDRQAATPTSFFLDLSQLRAGDEILTVGFPASIPEIREILKTHGRPLLRGGIISLILPEEITIGDREFADILLVDSWIFQGNSGGPVFWKPTLQRYADRGFNIRRPYIVGVVSDFLSWDAAIQPRTQSVQIASVNAGLSIVQAASGIEKTVAQLPGASCIPRPKTSQ